MARQMLARKNLILLHLDAYYTHLYWIPCLSFLHPRTMYQKTEVCILSDESDSCS